MIPAFAIGNVRSFHRFAVTLVDPSDAFVFEYGGNIASSYFIILLIYMKIYYFP
jgi:hypothetical protein